MDRSFASGASGSPPSYPGSPSIGYPTAGNPSTATPATKPGPWWYYMITEELRGVVVAAGLTPDGSNTGQLSQAIAKLVQVGQRAVVLDSATFNAGVANGNAVYWDSANSRFDKALADGSVKQNMVGIADVTNSKVCAFGDATSLTGLTAGARYYLDGTTAGAITTTAPTNQVLVGIAKSTTELYVDIDPQVTSQTKQIQSISASVAGNALTLNYAGGTLDFRSATLATGAPIAGVVVASNSITVPSGATLGMANGVAARLVLLEAYNGGSPVLCVANLAGGLSFDETGLISPTTISSGATSAGVIYSASAVSAGSPYRVVGYADVTEATAGTWASAPTVLQGAGGLAGAFLTGHGVGQTWQDVSGSRTTGTTYYNTTGRPIAVQLLTGGSGGALTPTVGGVALCATNNSPGTIQTQTYFVVPPGMSYSVATSGPSIGGWKELR